MSYSDSEDYECEIDVSEEMYDNNFTLAEETFNSLRSQIEVSENPWLLSVCSVVDLYEFIDTGEITLQHYTSNYDDNVQKAPEPINYVYEEDQSDWMTLKKNGEWEEAINKAEVKKAELLEEQRKAEIRAKTEANKHNWNLTREVRGLPKIVKKVVKTVRPKTQKLRKFKVNKSYSSICKQ